MFTKVMKGVRVLEVAQFTFVPAAGALLADWGADVIKVEHPTRGDTQRGFINLGGVAVEPDRHPLVEHPNRGKLSIGIDITTAEGQELLHELAKTADVFLTNYRPSQRKKFKFDLDDIRKANPNIIYARGSAYGDKGPERDTGGYDGSAFWTRSGIAMSMTPEGMDGVIAQGSPAFGDSIGGMSIAGGIAAALFHRLNTGEAVELDVSLLSTAWWAAGANLIQGMEYGVTSRSPMPGSGGAQKNPFMGNFQTSDNRTINLCMPSPTGLIRDTFEHMGLEQAADDPQFQDVYSLIENADAASKLLVDAFKTQPYSYWVKKLATMKGQWAPAQTLVELGFDEQALANDMVCEIEASDGSPFKVVRGPVQFNHEKLKTTRAPLSGEHTESILLDLGIEWDKIESLKKSKTIN